jgi:hypothetical protein
MSTRTACVVACVALALSIVGCDEDECALECSPCPPTLATVVVTDAATGGPVSGASVSGGGASWTCVDADGHTRLYVFPRYDRMLWIGVN